MVKKKSLIERFERNWIENLFLKVASGLGVEKKMRKLATAVFMMFLLAMLVNAEELPKTVTSKEITGLEKFFKDFFSVTTEPLAISSQSYPTTINRGETVDVTLNVKFLHDSEKSRFDVSWVLPDGTGSFAGSWNWNVQANQGDWFSTSINGITTSKIPDAFCGKTGRILIRHFSYYGGLYHLETLSVSGTTGTFFNCGSNLCDEKAVGDPFCKFGDRVSQKWQTINCQTTDKNVDYCTAGEVCENAKCVPTVPSCTPQTFDPFCDGNAVKQTIKKSDCSEQTSVVQNCQYGCQGGVCVTQACGNGIVESGENCNTCPADVACSTGQVCSTAGVCATPPDTETACRDGVDNDLDGLTDCEDPDCSLDSSCPVVDTDGDGVIDSFDNCPNTPSGVTGFGVDERGCSFIQKYGWTTAYVLLGTLGAVGIGVMVVVKRKKRRRK